MQMLMQFKQFVSGGITPEKAQSIIQEKLKSGEMSEEQFAQLKNQAQQFSEMLNFFK